MLILFQTVCFSILFTEFGFIVPVAPHITMSAFGATFAVVPLDVALAACAAPCGTFLLSGLPIVSGAVTVSPKGPTFALEHFLLWFLLFQGSTVTHSINTVTYC